MEREIVLVSGAPGSGKSTLAKGLAESLHANLIGKDFIKETLWDLFDPPAGDLAWSKRLGAAAMEVMWTLAAQSHRVVLEANFRPHSDYEKTKLRGLSANLIEVYCQCPPEVALERYERRAEKSTHHPAHVTPTLDPSFLAEFDQPIGLGPVVRVDTTLPIDIETLTQQVSVFLSPG
jgi:predicted kinase